MPTVVIGTAGHIDHGKTTLLRALTGIDADRLPEERARGMTIDVGFAHLDLDDGTSLDFVDVPGHDRLVGNMLVGAGEIDAVLLVVAADDGPRAQTLEHLELLDALGLRRAVVAITKADAAAPERRAEVASDTRALVDRTTLRGAPIVEVASVTGSGLPELRLALVALRDAVIADRSRRRAAADPLRLAIDRAFGVKGRGLVVTGTLRGGAVRAGSVLRLEPDGGEARVREVQVHHGPAVVADGGRAALNVAGLEAGLARRGAVLTAGPEIVASDRLLVALRPPALLAPAGRMGAGETPVSRRWPPRASAALQLHLWTATADASVRPIGRAFVPLADGAVAAMLGLAAPVAAMAGANAVLRDPGSARTIAGVTILDPRPPRGVSRRRLTPERVVALAAAVASGDTAACTAALLELHGARGGDPFDLAADVTATLAGAATELAAAAPTIAELRTHLGRVLRRQVAIARDDAAGASRGIDALIERLVGDGTLVRDGNRVRQPGAEGQGQANQRSAALDRLVASLDLDVPPSLTDAVQAAGCEPDAPAQLERGGRIVRVDDDLAWSAPRYQALRERAVAMARRAPLTPAAFRDAIGGNRRVVMPLLEDFDRKGFLRRTPAGHVPGPRA